MEANYWKRSMKSRRALLKGTGLGVAGAVSTFLVGCGDDDDAPGSTATVPSGELTATSTTVPSGELSATPTAGPEQGGTVRFGGNETTIGSPDIHQATSYAEVQVAQWSLDTLFGLDEPVPAQFKQIPQLAESLEQPDDLTYIYKIRKGVRYHDIAPVNGREFTAEDAVFSLKRMATDDPRYIRRSWFEKVTAFEALDPYTLRIRTSEPSAALSYLLASPFTAMVAREQVERDGEKLKTYIGTGPYITDRLEPGSVLNFSRNPNLPKGTGYFDKIEYVQVADPQAWAAAFRADEVQQITQIPADLIENMKKQVPTAHQYTTPSPGLACVGINNRREPFGDVRVRKAIAYACDIPGWIQVVLGGRGVLTGPMAPAFADWALPESKLKYHAQNIAEAKKLLDAAAVQPSALNVKVLTIGQFPPYLAAATQFQADMKLLGVSVTLDTVTTADYTSRFFAKHDFDLVVGGDFSPDDPNQLYDRLHSKGSGNYSGYANAEVDRLLAEQRQTLDRGERKQLVAKAQEIVVDDVPTFYTYNALAFAMAAARLQNWRVSAIGGNGPRWNARNAWVKK